MIDQTELGLIQVEADEGLGPPVWSQYLEQRALVLLSGPVTAADRLLSTRLLTVTPDRPESYATIVQAADGERLASPVFCRDDALMYLAEQNGLYRLQKQTPGLRAQTLLTLDHPVQLLACK